MKPMTDDEILAYWQSTLSKPTLLEVIHNQADFAQWDKKRAKECSQKGQRYLASVHTKSAARHERLARKALSLV